VRIDVLGGQDIAALWWFRPFHDDIMRFFHDIVETIFTSLNCHAEGLVDFAIGALSVELIKEPADNTTVFCKTPIKIAPDLACYALLGAETWYLAGMWEDFAYVCVRRIYIYFQKAMRPQTIRHRIVLYFPRRE
jgi:hypothetical protein